MTSAVKDSCKCTIYPRRLVPESHRSFLHGKITATSKARNLSLRRLAICDMAAIVSRQCISSASLSRARLVNLQYAVPRYHSGQYCSQYLLAGMVEYGVNFATFEALDAKALGFLHDSLKRMWRAEEDKRELREGELSASSSEKSSDEAMISCTFPQSVRPGGGEVQGSSAATENPANPPRSMLVGFASAHSEDDEDDKS